MNKYTLMVLLCFALVCKSKQSNHIYNTVNSSHYTVKNTGSSYDEDDPLRNSYIQEDDEGEDGSADSDDKASDGVHEATVEYYNSHTGTTSTYTLPVNVEDGHVTRINFPNGGYLADYHYTSDNEIDENGEVTITSDESDNVEYKVTIED